MIKINYKESILKHIKEIEFEVEYQSIIKAINNPECHDPSFYDDDSFEDIVMFRKYLIDFSNRYTYESKLQEQKELLNLLNKLIIERVKRIVIVEGNK